MSVSLTKGQTVSLTKPTGAGLTRVRMGLGWDAVAKRGFFGKIKTQSIDLDASCVVLDEAGRMLDAVYFSQLTSKDGAIIHTGDNLTGEGEGDDESIIVDLVALNPAAATLVFTVSSFTGQDFSQIENAFCRLVDETNRSEVARFELSASGRHTGQIMAKVVRDHSGWAMTALGEPASGRTFKELMPQIARVL